MCFDHDSRPPIAPIEGGSLEAKDLVLDAADGNRFMAYQARAAEPDGSAIIVLPDVRGLHAYYRDLALRFAEHGTEAVAIDYFGRTAGIGDRGPGFDYQPHVPQTTYEGLRADIDAAAAQLRSTTSATRLYTVGFCMGGRLAFLTDGVRPRAGRRDRLLRLADGDRAQRHARAGGRRGHVRGAGPRPVRGRGRGHQRGGARDVRDRAPGRGRPPQARHVRQRAALASSTARRTSSRSRRRRRGTRCWDSSAAASRREMSFLKRLFGGSDAPPVATPPVDPAQAVADEQARDRELLLDGRPVGWTTT